MYVMIFACLVCVRAHINVLPAMRTATSLCRLCRTKKKVPGFLISPNSDLIHLCGLLLLSIRAIRCSRASWSEYCAVRTSTKCEMLEEERREDAGGLQEKWKGEKERKRRDRQIERKKQEGTKEEKREGIYGWMRKT